MKNVVSIAAGTVTLFLLAVYLFYPKENKPEINYYGDIDGKKVFYRTGRIINDMKIPDIMKIYDIKGNEEHCMEDYNRNGVIGDDPEDRYEKMVELEKDIYNLDSPTMTKEIYKKYLMIRKDGVLIYYDPLQNWKYDDGLPRESFDENIAIEAEKKGMEELRNATQLYQSMLKKINAEYENN